MQAFAKGHAGKTSRPRTKLLSASGFVLLERDIVLFAPLHGVLAQRVTFEIEPSVEQSASIKLLLESTERTATVKLPKQQLLRLLVFKGIAEAAHDFPFVYLPDARQLQIPYRAFFDAAVNLDQFALPVPPRGRFIALRPLGEAAEILAGLKAGRISGKYLLQV